MKIVRSRRALLIVGAIGFASGAAAFGLVPASSASPNAGPSPVIVQNTGANPIPVLGSVGVSGTVGIDPTKNHVNVDNLPGTYPVTGSVSVSGALPAGSNNIGSVSIARGAPYQVVEINTVSDSTATGVFADRAGTLTGVLLESISIQVQIPVGEVLTQCYVETAPSFVAMFVPVSKQGSDGSVDYYDGTIAVQLHAAPGEGFAGFCNRPFPGTGPMRVEATLAGEDTPS
jgi:hypothetical protein